MEEYTKCCCNSILLDIKKLLGFDKDYIDFDKDIIININSVFMVLNQLGVGPNKPYTIYGEEETWNDFLGDSLDYELVKSYIYLKVRLIFDPPSTGVLHEAIERQINEYEWRLTVQASFMKSEKGDDSSG